MPDTKALVTGRAGFIGSHAVDRVLEEGHEMTAVDNLSEGHLRRGEAESGESIRGNQVLVGNAGVHVSVNSRRAASLPSESAGGGIRRGA